MPEEIEVDTDSLREQIDHEIEREKAGERRLTRTVALSTSILAARAAFASLRAGATANEALLLKTEATQLQSQASDQWAYYQAKGIKGAVAEAQANTWRAAGKAVPAEITANAARYGAEQRAITDSAHAKEHDRDERSAEAAELMHRHHGFANAVALFQVAIALGAVAALTRSRPVVALSMLAGVIGIGFLLTHLVR
jgi:hypothetical protein